MLSNWRTRVKEVRMYFKSDALDTDEMERDLNREWNAIFSEYGVVSGQTEIHGDVGVAGELT